MKYFVTYNTHFTRKYILQFLAANLYFVRNMVKNSLSLTRRKLKVKSTHIYREQKHEQGWLPTCRYSITINKDSLSFSVSKTRYIPYSGVCYTRENTQYFKRSSYRLSRILLTLWSHFETSKNPTFLTATSASTQCLKHLFCILCSVLLDSVI